MARSKSKHKRCQHKMRLKARYRIKRLRSKSKQVGKSANEKGLQMKRDSVLL